MDFARVELSSWDSLFSSRDGIEQWKKIVSVWMWKGFLSVKGLAEENICLYRKMLVITGSKYSTRYGI